jgi:uncharacterized protein (TIGR02453 family)
VKTPHEKLTAVLAAELTRFAPRYATEPKKAMYRIYRDTRFSADKTPYKSHAASLFYRADLGKDSSAAFYFHISNDEVGIGGGVYMPSAEQMRLLRGHFAAHHQRFRRLVEDKTFKKVVGAMQGESLTRPPKGFPPDHPAMDLIKAKQWFFWKELDPKLALTPMLYVEVVTAFEVLAPVIEFLNEPMAAAARKSSARYLE